MDFGPVRLELSNEGTRFGRTDIPNAPQLLLRELGDVLALVIEFRVPGCGIVERPLAHVPKSALDAFFRPWMEAMQREVASVKPTTPEDLARRGYVVCVIEDPEELRPFGVTISDTGMKWDLARIEVFERDGVPDGTVLPYYDPDVLNLDEVRAKQSLIAICTADGGGPQLGLIWVASRGTWFERDTSQIGGESLEELGRQAVARLPRRAASILDEIVRELHLNEGVDQAAAQTFRASIEARPPSSVYEEVVDTTWSRVHAVQHHCSAGAFAGALARQQLQPGAPASGFIDAGARLHRLDGFEEQLYRDGICKLVEEWEHALKTVWEIARGQTWKQQDRPAYDKLGKAHPDRPESILGAVAEGDKSLNNERKLVTELRNLWTHRGVVLDARFWKEAGVAKAREINVAGLQCKLNEADELVVSIELVGAVARWVGSSIQRLADSVNLRFRPPSVPP